MQREWLPAINLDPFESLQGLLIRPLVSTTGKCLNLNVDEPSTKSQAQQEVGSTVQDGRVSILAAYLDLVGILGLNTAEILGPWKD